MGEDDPFPVAQAEPAPAPKAKPRRHRRKASPEGAHKTEAQKAAALANLEKARAARGMGPSRTATDKIKADALVSLKRWRAEIGAGGLMLVPVPATYIARTDDEILEAMVQLAGRNSKILAGIAAGGDVLAAIVVLRWSAGLVVSAGVQFGRVAPDSRLAETFGISGIVEDLARQGLIGVEAVEAEGVEGATTTDERPTAPGLVAIPV